MSYIGNYDQDAIDMKDDLYRVEFTYPSQPKAVPMTNAVRKGNVLCFSFRTIPDDAAFDKLVKFAESSFVNTAEHITKPRGGVVRKVWTRENSTEWTLVKDRCF